MNAPAAAGQLDRPAIPIETVRAILRAIASGTAPLRARPPLTLSAWAAQHFFLSAEGSHMQGRWIAYPFQTGWMDAFSNDDIEEVTLKKAKRVGYTKTLLAFIAYNAAHRRRKQALWQPTDDDRDSFVKSEIDPMLRDVHVLAEVMRKGRSLGEDTMKLKTFLGSVLHLLGGKAARSYRRITLAVSMLDEADGFDRQIEKSSDPVTLARGRLEGAPFPKLIVGSTPRVRNASHVEDREAAADAVMRYCIPCIHCGVEHPLQFGGKQLAHGFKWDGRDTATVRHLCPHCHGSIVQADYLRVWHLGIWTDQKHRYTYGQDAIWRDSAGMPCRAPRHVAFQIWTAYSPQRAWADIVREFLEAADKLKAGDVGPMQGFVNETLGETWEERGESADEHELARRPHAYAIRTVPKGCLILFAGVDVQDNRFEVVVWGFGRGEEMWAIDYVVLDANPADERDWLKLDAYLRSRFPQADRRGALGIDATGIDTGGHFTHQVYNFARVRERMRVAALKGSSFDGRPIKGKASRQDVNFGGAVIKRGVKVWEVGTDTAKDLLHGRLKVTSPGPGFVNFPQGLDDAFYAQLTAEHRVLQKTSVGEKYRWVKKRSAQRNEVLDCTVYALFAAQLLDLNRYTQAMWDRLAAAVEPAPDLFDGELDAPAPRAAEPPPPPPEPRPSRSTAREW